MTLDLNEVLVKSPKRAVKKMLRKLNRDRSKPDDGTDKDLDFATIHIPDMDPLDPSAELDEDAQLSSSFSGFADEVVDLDAGDDFLQAKSKKPSTKTPSEKGKRTATNKLKAGNLFNPYAGEQRLSPFKKSKPKVCVDSSSRDLGGRGSNECGGYNSDGAVSKRKKELRAKAEASKKIKSPKSGRRASLRAKLASIGGSDRSVKSASAGSAVAKRRSTKAKTLNPSDGKESNTTTGDAAETKEKSSGSKTATRRRSSVKKALNREGSERSMKSSCSTRKRRSSTRKKKSDLDGSEHSTKSSASGVAGKSKAGKNKKAESGLDGGSEHSSRSASSTKVKKSSKKRSKSTKGAKSVRGGKRSVPPPEAPPEEVDYHSDGQMSLASTLSSKPSKGKSTPRGGRRINPLEDEMESPAGRKMSLCRFLPSEIKLALNPDDDEFRPSAPLRTRSVDCSPSLPRRSPDLGLTMSPKRALSHEPWQPPLASAVNPGGNLGRWGTNGAMTDKEAKDYEEALEKRLIEIGEREKLVEEAQTLRKARNDLVHRTKSLELQLEEELKKNIGLRRSLIYHEQQPTESKETETLRNQAKTLLDEKEALNVKLRAVEHELDQFKRSSDTSDVASMSIEQLRTCLIQTRARLSDRDSAISSLTKEIQDLKEQLQGSSSRAQKRSKADQEVIETLEKANETLKRALELERIGTDKTVKSKDETIQYLMHELGKLEVIDADVSAGLACRFGSVFNLSSPGAVTHHKEGFATPTISPTCVSDF
eukprot:CAMPEP_0117056666 /NCGR_PEP_ID=MMETSP0472-20121206/39326_1 /TAXON_ID=693140 ORGANISM="Tiarina fusus, Strain LIS" /NCGR_SAMPLE_ID=MMETSP0472 /ASSEMBLY_ACC=CAM_ASM_000603 /LENGTH=763 /DNA_ID=CAMNT_0004773223 /DNA_START=151 /DNA_END=2442 /DNA_ORIENTATION=+